MRGVHRSQAVSRCGASGRCKPQLHHAMGMGEAVGGGEYAITTGEAFIWKSDRAEVSLTHSSEGWLVRYSTVGRLMGPPQVLHQARHRDAKLATWDVMARVNSASNESEMMRAGTTVVQWINGRQRSGPGGKHSKNGVR